MAKAILPDWAIGTYRKVKLRALVDGFDKKIVTHDYGGHRLTISIEDPLACGWYDNDWPDLPELALLKRHRLKPGVTVFDVGAHHGVVALMLARIVGDVGRVVAVEGGPHNAAVARRNRELNAAGCLHVVHAAVGSSNGEIDFNLGLNGQVDDGTGAWGKVKVPLVTVDELAVQYGTPTVLFIDVEGFEAEVLSGASRTLMARPDCFVEVHRELQMFGASVETVISYFATDAYELYMNVEDHDHFVPFERGHAWTEGRFYLIALAKGSDV